MEVWNDVSLFLHKKDDTLREIIKISEGIGAFYI